MGKTKRLIMPVTGMSCSNCALNIETAMRKVNGIIEANVDFADEKLNVLFDPDMISDKGIIDKVKERGYKIAVGYLELGLQGIQDQTDCLMLERILLKNDGILECRVNPGTENSIITYIPGMISVAGIAGIIRNAGFGIIENANPEQPDDDLAEQRNREMIRQLQLLTVGLIFTVPLILFSMAHDFGVVGFRGEKLVMLIAASIVQFVSGWQFYTGAWNSLRHGSANMDVLIMTGSSVAYFSSLLVVIGIIDSENVYFETSATIITLIRLGKYLEAKARGKTSEALKKLISLNTKKATVLRDDIEQILDTDDVKIGDIVVVRPGEKVPVDGIILEGRSAFEESMISGESMPVIKGPGDEIIGASINREGVVKFEVTRVGSNTTLSQIVRMVKEAQASKAPIQKLTDEISRYFVPIIISLAILTFFGWIFIAGQSWQFAMLNAIAVLVIACPCAIGLATPTAIIVGTSRGAENGILFRNSEMLEKAGKVSLVVLDKTGTITRGEPELADIISLSGLSVEELLFLAATAEKGSEHPVGRAVVKAAEQKGIETGQVKQFKSVTGFGIRAVIGNKSLLLGNRRMMQNEGILLDQCLDKISNLQNDGKTVIILSLSDNTDKPEFRPAGLLAVSDIIKPGAKEAVESLKQMGLDVVMITGDNKPAAEAVARQVGIERVIAEVLPGGKVEEIRKIQASDSLGNFSNPLVAMVGDGINDAPALAQADVGIAIGTGSDVALASAGITLIGGDLSGIAKAISLSRGTSQTIVQNLIWAFFYNICLIPVAAYGLLAPMFAAGAMAFSSIFVVTNSLRLRTFQVDSKTRVKTLFRQFLDLLPKTVIPAVSLLVLIVVPMVFMGGNMEIRGARTEDMTPVLMMTMAIANALIAVSYMSIPFFLIVFIRRRKDMPFTWVIFLFGLFIFSCGTTHLVHIVGLWWKVDWWQATVDFICAVASVATAVAIWPVLPKLLSIPSPKQLKMVNSELQKETERLEYTQAALKKAYSEIEHRVEERTRELMITNKLLLDEIAERKKAEEALQTSEKKFRKMVETLPLVIHQSYGPDQITEFINPEFKKVFGYEAEEIHSAYEWWPLAYPDESYRKQISDKWNSLVLKAIETQSQVEPFESEVTCKDGSKKTIIWRYITMGDKNYSCGLDITDLKKAEMQLQELNKNLERRIVERTAELETANRELESFSYSVSHDLRAPLRHINSYASLLSSEFKDQIPAEAGFYLKHVTESAKKLGVLIDELLNFSRTGRVEIKKTTFDMRRVVDDALLTVRKSREDQIIEANIADLPEVTGDITLLSTVWINLIDNAMKYSKTRELVKITIEYRNTPYEHIFSISDKGVGFDNKYAEKIFGVFNRLHSQSEYEGSGIGLANVKKIITRHGGRVWAEGFEGKGAVFGFTIPK